MDFSDANPEGRAGLVDHKGGQVSDHKVKENRKTGPLPAALFPDADHRDKAGYVQHRKDDEGKSQKRAPVRVAAEPF